MPCRRAASWTNLSALSIFKAPLLSARAAQAGRDNSCAAAAYLSNGTNSSRDAPSLVHTFQHEIIRWSARLRGPNERGSLSLYAFRLR